MPEVAEVEVIAEGWWLSEEALLHWADRGSYGASYKPARDTQFVEPAYQPVRKQTNGIRNQLVSALAS